MIFLGVGSECLKDAKSQVEFFLKQILPGNSTDLIQKIIQPTNKLTLELFHKTSRSVFSSEQEENIYSHFIQKLSQSKSIGMFELEIFAIAILFHTNPHENLPSLRNYSTCILQILGKRLSSTVNTLEMYSIFVEDMENFSLFEMFDKIAKAIN